MVVGVNGQPGVPAVKPAGRAPGPVGGCVIPLQMLTVENPALDQSLRKRLAAINLAIPKVRISHFNIQFAYIFSGKW